MESSVDVIDSGRDVVLRYGRLPRSRGHVAVAISVGPGEGSAHLLTMMHDHEPFSHPPEEARRPSFIIQATVSSTVGVSSY